MTRNLKGWQYDLVTQFYRHLRHRGYCATNAGHYARRLRDRILATGLPRRRFIRQLAQQLTTHIQEVGPLKEFDRPLANFLLANRLAPSKNLSASGHLGRAAAIVRSAPEKLRPGIDLQLRLMLEEREYRDSLGEPLITERAVRYYIKRLAEWAHWLASVGVDSWQELTATRFRERLLTGDVVRGPHAVCHHFGDLVRFLDLLKLERLVFKNPLLAARRPRRPELTQRPVSDEAIRQWLRLIADQSADACDRAIAALVVLHGLSPKEVGDLRLRDYGRRKRVLRVARRNLVLDLDPVTAEAIDAYVRARPAAALNSFLFVTHRTRLGDEPISNGFVALRLRPFGIATRATRQRLMRMLAVDDGVVIAARYFRTDVRVVDGHNAHQVSLFRKSSRAVTESVQAAL